MGIGMLGNALAGLGAGVVSITNKWIDEEAQANKAKLLADLQVSTADRISRDSEKRDAEFAQAKREREAAGIASRAAATNQAQVDAEISNAGNVGLQGARDEAATREATRKATATAAAQPTLTAAEIAADNAKRDGTRASRIAEANAMHDAQVSQKIADSRNPSLLKAMEDLELASPKMRAEIDDKKADATMKRAHAGYFVKAGNALETKAAGAGKAERMDEADKIEYQNLFGEVKDAMKNQAKFEAEGQPLDADGKPSAQYKIVKGNVDKAQQKLLSFQMRKGLVNPEDDAKRVISGEQDSTKIGAAIAQAFQLGGSEYGDAFYAAVRKSGVLENNAEIAANRKGAGSGKGGASSSAGGATKHEYGMLSGPRVSYLETLERAGKLSPSDAEELRQLRDTKDKAWFRGRATREDSLAD